MANNFKEYLKEDWFYNELCNMPKAEFNNYLAALDFSLNYKNSNKKKGKQYGKQN